MTDHTFGFSTSTSSLHCLIWFNPNVDIVSSFLWLLDKWYSWLITILELRHGETSRQIALNQIHIHLVLFEEFILPV